jgi:hypothetical protein
MNFKFFWRLSAASESTCYWPNSKTFCGLRMLIVAAAAVASRIAMRVRPQQGLSLNFTKANFYRLCLTDGVISSACGVQ